MAEIFAEAEQLERSGELRQAVEAYARMSEAGLGGAQALVRQAMLRRQCGEVSRPVALLREAARLDPADPYPHMRLGQVAEGLRRHALSASHYRDAVATTPWSAEMQVNLAAAYSRLYWLDLACRTARTIPPDVSDWWAGARRLGLQAYRERRRELLQALKDRPRPLDRESIWPIARHLYHLGRLRLARRLCQDMIASDADWFWPVWLNADIIARQEGAAAALDYLHGSYWVGLGSPEYLEAEARLMLEAGRYAEFLQRLDEDPHTERRERVHDTAVVALYVLDRGEELKRYCLDWMREAPKLATPAAFLALAEMRRSAFGPEEGKARPRAHRAHLMQFWNAPSAPADVTNIMQTWTRAHPGWDHTVFDAAAAERFLLEHLGDDAGRAFRLCYHPAMMADMFRVAFLSVAGGFYVDADERCLHPLTDMLPDPASVELVAPHSGGAPGFVDNNFIGCRPGGAVCRTAAASIVEDVLQCAHEDRRPDIWQVTGPGCRTRAVAQHLASRGTQDQAPVVLLPMQQYRAFVRTEEDLDYKRNPAANWRLAELT